VEASIDSKPKTAYIIHLLNLGLVNVYYWMSILVVMKKEVNWKTNLFLSEVD